MENTGNPGEDEGKTASPGTVANSRRFRKNAKRSIMSTGNDITNVAPELQVRLEIVEQALLNYQKIGGSVEVLKFRQNKTLVAIVLEQVVFCDGCHHFSAGTVCQYCAGTKASEVSADAG